MFYPSLALFYNKRKPSAPKNTFQCTIESASHSQNNTGVDIRVQASRRTVGEGLYGAVMDGRNFRQEGLTLLMRTKVIVGKIWMRCICTMAQLQGEISASVPKSRDPRSVHWESRAKVIVGGGQESVKSQRTSKREAGTIRTYIHVIHTQLESIVLCPDILFRRWLTGIMRVIK